MTSTDKVDGAIGLCPCYAMPGTDLVYVPTRCYDEMGCYLHHDHRCLVTLRVSCYDKTPPVTILLQSMLSFTLCAPSYIAACYRPTVIILRHSILTTTQRLSYCATSPHYLPLSILLLLPYAFVV
eukprot:1469506-Rhodomonas_salina.2